MGSKKGEMTETITLKEYVDIRFKMSDDSVGKAQVAMERRLESMNEFRAQLNKQTETFATKEMLYAKIDALEKSIAELQKSKSNLDGRFWAIGAGLALVFTLVNVALRFIP